MPQPAVTHNCLGSISLCGKQMAEVLCSSVRAVDSFTSATSLLYWNCEYFACCNRKLLQTNRYTSNTPYYLWMQHNFLHIRNLFAVILHWYEKFGAASVECPVFAAYLVTIGARYAEIAGHHPNGAEDARCAERIVAFVVEERHAGPLVFSGATATDDAGGSNIGGGVGLGATG